jgi:hypothetical protein
MDTRDLRYFIAAAETGHLHQAVERVGRSQPALSNVSAAWKPNCANACSNRPAEASA